MQHPVEQSKIYPLLIPQFEMKLTALLTLLVQVRIGSHFCLQVTQLMCLDAVELSWTLPFLWPLVSQRLSLNLALPAFQFAHKCFGLAPSFLSRSLINPNQLQMSGALVHHDPTTDGDKEFGLIADNLFIPSETAGTTVHFESMAPDRKSVV